METDQYQSIRHNQSNVGEKEQTSIAPKILHTVFNKPQHIILFQEATFKVRNPTSLPVDHVQNEYSLQSVYFSTYPTATNACASMHPNFLRAFPDVKIKCRRKKNKI